MADPWIDFINGYMRQRQQDAVLNQQLPAQASTGGFDPNAPREPDKNQPTEQQKMLGTIAQAMQAVQTSPLFRSPQQAAVQNQPSKLFNSYMRR